MDKDSDHKKTDTSAVDYTDFAEHFERKSWNSLAAAAALFLFAWIMSLFEWLGLKLTNYATTYIDFVYSRFDDPFAYFIIPAPLLIMLAMLFIWRQLRKPKYDDST